MKIEGEAAVDQAKLAAEAQNINAVSLNPNCLSYSFIQQICSIKIKDI